MTTQFHPNFLNRFVAPGISEFNAAVIPDIRSAHPEAENWMENHFFNNLLRGTLVGDHRQFAVNLLFRAQAHFSQYHQARDTTLEFLAETSLHSPALKPYFRAVTRWETCLLSYQVFVDLLQKMSGPSIFQSKDGSAEQRAYDIANAIKHGVGSIDSTSHDVETLPMWLSNDGFHTRELSLTYGELSALTNDVAKIANEIQDPPSLVASFATLQAAAVPNEVSDVIQDMKVLDQWLGKE